MKLLTTLSFHCLVYVGTTILITTAKLTNTVSAKMSSTKVEEVKPETASVKEGTHILHSELLLRY